MVKPYYETKSGKLYHGDCLDILPELEPVDLVVTSPPYDDLRKYEGYEFDFEATARALKDNIKTGGVIVWVVGDQTKNGSESGTSFKQALYFKDLGLNLHDTMIYHGGSRGAFGSNKAYWSAFEYMFIFSNGNIKTFNPIIDRPNKSFGRKITGTHRKKDGETKKINGYGKAIKEFSKRTNVWNIRDGKRQHGHPAIFPEALARDHVISWSNEGDLVLDCFGGSGTTLKQAELLKRRWVGIEIEEKYCEIIAKRIEAENKQRKLF